MANLGSLFYTLGIKDMTESDIKKINDRLKNLGANLEVKVDPGVLRDSINSSLPKGIKIDLEGRTTTEALQRAVEGKVIKVEVMPLISRMRSELKTLTQQAPLEVAVSVNEAQLRKTIENVCLSRGYMLTINSINDEFSKHIRARLDGQTYQVKITCDPTVISQSVKSALSSMRTDTFGLKVSQDILRKSIDDALRGHQFPIQIKVMKDQARAAVQNALNGAANVTGADARKYRDLQTGELRAAQAELARLRAAHLDASNAAGIHASTSLKLGGIFGSNIRLAGELGSAMAGLYSVHAAKEFLSQVIDIGGELEHQKIALEAIYDSSAKMETLFSQIKGLARTSPFGVMDLTKNIKQLSAYGVQYNEVFDTAKRLADISAATSVDMNRLILAFGKTKNRTFLDGLEAKQFAYANIPIYEALSKKLTELEGNFVSVKDVMGRIKKREIGFDMVKEILWDMTDAGGKFYNMQEKLAGSVKTSWKLVRDNIELMFGEIAEGSIGDLLKWFGQLLQGLTRNWETFATVLGIGTAAFALSRIAIAANNAMLEKNTIANIKSLASQRATISANATAAMTYRDLTAAESVRLNASRGLHKIEGLRIFTRQQLTEKEVQAMITAKALTREEVLKLVALRKVSVATAENVLITQKMTATNAAATRVAIADAAATKRRTVVMAQFRASVAGVGAALKSLLLSPWTIAIAGMTALVTLWQRHSQEQEKAEEIGKNIFSKAVDSAKELKGVVEGLKPAGQLSDLELTQGIERMEEAIKDMSPTPMRDINATLVDQSGHVLSLIERYEALKKKVYELSDAYQYIEATPNNNGVSSMIESALKATNEGWFWDGLETNAKDYTNSLKRKTDAVVNFAKHYQKTMEIAMSNALAADQKFAKATEGMSSYEERLKYFAENYQKYQEAVRAFDSYLESRNFKQYKISKIANTDQIKDTYDELTSDIDKFITDMNTRMRSQGMNPFLLTDGMKASLQISLKNMLDSMESAGEEAKMIMAKKFEETWGLVLVEDKVTPILTEKFRKVANDSSDAAVQEAMRVWQIQGWNKLSATQQELLKKLFDTAKTQAKGSVESIVGDMNQYLAAHPGQWTIVVNAVSADLQSEQSEWAKQAIAARGGLPGISAAAYNLLNAWGKDGTNYGARNAAQQALQEAENELKSYVTEADKLTPQYKKAVQKKKEVMEALTYLGWTDIEIKDQKSNKHSSKGVKKDLVAEKLKQRFKDIKDAWSEFGKWQKLLGTTAAAKKIADSGLFGDMTEDMVPKTEAEFKNLVEKLRADLEAAGVKGHSQRESLLNEIIKQIFDIDRTQAEKDIRRKLDEVTKEAEKQIADWNLYERLFNATGNRQFAFQFSFGARSRPTDYTQMIKSQFAATAKALGHDVALDALTYDTAVALGDDIAKAWKKATDDITKYEEEQREIVADMLSEYQTTQEKIAAIEAERDEKIRRINESKDLKDSQKNVLIQRIRVEYDYKSFQLSGQYLKFFNAILSMTSGEAEKVGRKIKKNLDNKLQKGLITAKEYADEIKQINKQLDKIRNKQSDFSSFMQGGLNELFQKKYDQAESDFNAAVQSYSDAQGMFEKAMSNDDNAGMMNAQSKMDEASAMQEDAGAAMQGAQGAMDTIKTIDMIVHSINDTVQGIKGAFDLISEMADSYGTDTSADTGWGAAGAFLDAFSQASQHATDAWDSLKSGNAGGVIKGVVGSVTSWFTTFNQYHDARLQKKIERSQLQFQKWDYIIEAMERRMDRFLGNAARMNTGVAGGGYGKTRKMMEQQLAELEYQRRCMLDMKKKDEAAIAEIDSQISELRDDILAYSEEIIDDLYSINLKDWASQLGDALFDAWKKGEDGAEAFRKKAAEIIGDVMNNMLRLSILEPMMEDLREYLFGKDGKSGAFGEDFELDETDIATIADKLMEGTDKVDAYNAALDKLEKYLKDNYGVSLKDTDASSGGLSAGIQGITEDTADLLASYVNAIRASVFMLEQTNVEVRDILAAVAGESLPRMSAIAESQLAVQRTIAENTLANARAAQDILAMLRKCTTGASRIYIN